MSAFSEPIEGYRYDEWGDVVAVAHWDADWVRDWRFLWLRKRPKPFITGWIDVRPGLIDRESRAAQYRRALQ